MKVCDNCKQLPKPYLPADCDETCYFFRVEKSGDIVHLLSDLNYAFCAVPDPAPEPEEGFEFWCEKCIQASMDEIDNDKKTWEKP